MSRGDIMSPGTGAGNAWGHCCLFDRMPHTASPIVSSKETALTLLSPAFIKVNQATDGYAGIALRMP